MLRMKPLALMHQSVKRVSCTGVTAGGHGFGFVISHGIASHHIKDLTLGKAGNEFRLSRGRMGHSRRDLQGSLEDRGGKKSQQCVSVRNTVRNPCTPWDCDAAEQHP